MLLDPRTLIPLLLAGLALVLLFVFGAITLSTSLFTAIAVGIILVGFARLFMGTGHMGVLLIVGGVVVFLFSRTFPELTIADGLTFFGGA